MTARIPPLPPAEWPPVLRSLLADSPKDGPGRENLFGTLAHHPVLAHAWLSLARVLTHEGTLGERRHELVVLRTAHRLGGTFVYERHRAHAARAAGLTDAEILATAAPAESHPWSGEDRALLRACDLLAGGEPLPDGLWERLARTLRPEQLVELLVLTGQTAAMCTTLNALRTPSDARRTSSDGLCASYDGPWTPSDARRTPSDALCTPSDALCASYDGPWTPYDARRTPSDGLCTPSDSRGALREPWRGPRRADDVRPASDLCSCGAGTLDPDQEAHRP